MLTIRIKTDDDTFHHPEEVVTWVPGPELAKILHALAEKLAFHHYPDEGVLFDTNGNNVGTWKLTNR